MSLLNTTRSLIKNINLNKVTRIIANSQSRILNNYLTENHQQKRLISFNSNQNSILLNQHNLKLNNLIVRSYGHVPYTKDMIEQRVLLVLRLCDKIDPNKLTLSSDFTKDLGLDSLDQIDIVIAMEDEFNFEIPDVDGEYLVTPKHIVQYICDKFDVFH